MKCPACGVKREKVLQLPSKAPFSKRFEEAVGEACESASARQVARRLQLPASTVRAIDLRYLERWAAARRKPALRQMGIDELYLGKKQKFVTVMSNLESQEPLWFGEERKKETLDEFFRTQVSRKQRRRIEAACLDMWEPYRLSLQDWVPGCRLVYDKFHVLQHANGAIDEVRRAEFFRQGGRKRELVKGKRWLLLSRWVEPEHREETAAEPTLPVESPGDESLLAEREFESAVGVPLRGCNAAVPTELDRSTSLATPETLRKAGWDVARPSRRYSELLPHAGRDGRGGSNQRQYQDPAAARSRLQEPPLPASEGSTLGGYPDRIRHYQESSLKCGSVQIPAQNQ